MIPLTLSETAAAAGGTLHDADGATQVTGLTADSRAVTAGDLFAALQGERTHGIQFAAQALAAGAAAVLTERSALKLEQPTGSGTGSGTASGADPRPRLPRRLPRVEVDDALAALAAIGGAVRRRSDATVIGITGSSGKTLTKDLLAGVLATRLRTVAARGSFNNELGLPLTLARLEPDTEALVLEMGARGVGHIAQLCQVARPDVGVVTNVGVAHYGMFGSREAIAQAKGELVEALPASGAAVLNADDALVAAMAGRTRARVVTYGVSTPADVSAQDVTLDDLGRARFHLLTPDGEAPVSLPAPGEHLVADALAAAAAGWLLGVPPADTAQGLATATLSPNRMQVTRRGDGVIVLNDAYNANPVSMAAGLKALRVARPTGGRAIAVLGDMAELGEIAEAEHDRIGRLLVRLGIDRVIGIGPLARIIVEAARQEGIWDAADAVAVDDVDAARELLAGDLRAGDVVLVKASLATGLVPLATELAEGGPGPGAAAGGHGGRG